MHPSLSESTHRYNLRVLSKSNSKVRCTLGSDLMLEITSVTILTMTVLVKVTANFAPQYRLTYD